MFIATVVVSALLALAALGSGAGKLSKQPKLVEQLGGLGVPMSWLPRLAAAEIAGAVGLLVGLKAAPLGIAAGVGLVLYFVGAVATHLRKGDKNITAPAVLALLSVAAVVLRIVTM
jgi:hypothetical protein